MSHATLVQESSLLNPYLAPNRDEYLTSPYNITACIYIQVMRMKEIITQDKMSCR